MPWFRSLADPARRLLGPSLDRLHGTLSHLGGRLREAIAAAVARAAAGAVREAVAVLLADPNGAGPTPTLPPDERRPSLLGAPGRPLWPPAHHQGLGPGGREAPDESDDPDAGWGDLGALDDPEEPDEAEPAWMGHRPSDPPSPPAAAKPREGRWPRPGTASPPRRCPSPAPWTATSSMRRCTTTPGHPCPTRSASASTSPSGSAPSATGTRGWSRT